MYLALGIWLSWMQVLIWKTVRTEWRLNNELLLNRIEKITQLMKQTMRKFKEVILMFFSP